MGFIQQKGIDKALLDQFAQQITRPDKARKGFLYRLTLGDYYLENQKNDSLAVALYQEVIGQAQKNRDSLALCEAFKRILPLLVKNGEQRSLAQMYNHDYIQFAYDLNEQAQSLYYDIGIRMQQAERDQGQVDFQDQDFERLIELARKARNHYLEASSWQLYGVKKWGFDLDLDAALNRYNQALQIYENLDYEMAQKQLYGILVNTAAIHIQKQEAEDALSLLHQAKKIKLPERNKIDYILYYDKLVKSHVLLDNKDSVFFYLKQKDLAEKQAKTLQQARTITELRTKYLTSEKEKEALIQGQKARTNRNLLIASVLLALIGAVIAILLQKNTSKKRQLAEQEALLKQQRVDNLLKEQELVSIDAMIAGQEKERQKVAGELHDDLGSLMATIKLHFDNSKVSKKDPSLQSAQNLLDQAYQKIRGIAHNKNSGVMSDQGLLTAIQKMAHTISQSKAIIVTVEDFGLGERLENSLELSIFRMVQELVANAIKHAEASRIIIQLTQHEDKLNIIVEDNGKGFEPGQKDNLKNGMGLTNIEKRVEHLEGEFTIDSVVGRGTSIIIDIPV